MNKIYFFLFIIIIIIFLIIIIKYTNKNIINDHLDENLPTLHSKCDKNEPCGGDLICNKNCKRCKQKLGGNCSMDIDCDEGLKCYDWKCVSKLVKNVKWKDDI